MDASHVRVIPWSETDPPTETVLRRQFESEGLRATSWSEGGSYYYDPQTHAFCKILCVVEGDITFSLPELGREITLRPGDRLELPPGVLHHAFVGPCGVFCLEGKRLG